MIENLDYFLIGSVQKVCGDIIFKDVNMKVTDLPANIQVFGCLATGIGWYAQSDFPARGYIDNVSEDKFDIYAATNKNGEIISLELIVPAKYIKEEAKDIYNRLSTYCIIENGILNMQLAKSAVVRDFKIPVLNGRYDISVHKENGVKISDTSWSLSNCYSILLQHNNISSVGRRSYSNKFKKGLIKKDIILIGDDVPISSLSREEFEIMELYNVDNIDKDIKYLNCEIEDYKI